MVKTLFHSKLHNTTSYSCWSFVPWLLCTDDVTAVTNICVDNLSSQLSGKCGGVVSSGERGRVSEWVSSNSGDPGPDIWRWLLRSLDTASEDSGQLPSDTYHIPSRAPCTLLHTWSCTHICSVHAFIHYIYISRFSVHLSDRPFSTIAREPRSKGGFTHFYLFC